MRILYLSQYFPPEVGATQIRAYEMAKTWVDLGHSVTMLTEFPNHPSGIIPQKYKGKLFEKAYFDGINVFRVWVKTSPDKNFRTRMLFYLSYMVNAIISGIFLINGKFDLIYVTSPPLFVGGAGLLLSKIKHLQMVFEVRDLWPESAIELGELNNKFAISWATKLEEACYKRALQIIVVTKGIYNRLSQRGIPENKLFLAPNGSNISLFKYKPLDRENLRKDLKLEGKFIAIYAGIHGLAQGLETIIGTAKLLQNRHEFHFIFIGDGPKKKEIVELVQSSKLTNIHILPEIPRELIPGYLSMADVAIVPLRKVEIFKGALPSKIFDAWACQKPVILSIDGEARKLVETVDGGRYVPPEDSLKLAEEIQLLKKSPDDLYRMGKNGLAYTIRYHSRQMLAQKLIAHLQESLLND